MISCWNVTFTQNALRPCVSVGLCISILNLFVRYRCCCSRPTFFLFFFTLHPRQSLVLSHSHSLAIVAAAFAVLCTAQQYTFAPQVVFVVVAAVSVHIPFQIENTRYCSRYARYAVRNPGITIMKHTRTHSNKHKNTKTFFLRYFSKKIIKAKEEKKSVLPTTTGKLWARLRSCYNVCMYVCMCGLNALNCILFS